MGQGQLINIDINSIAVREYQTKIQGLITRLNNLNPDEYPSQINELLQQFRTVDQQFLAQYELSINGHVLFSRHGESNDWSQKKLGLNPNAPLADQAIKKMSQTNKATKNLLHYPDKTTHISISPLVRAKQTARLLIPEDLTSAKISIQPALSENSDSPSGNNITSLNQMKEQFKQMSFWETPLKVILYALSLWLYGNSKVFRKIQIKSKQEDDIILERPGVDSQTYYSKGLANPDDGIHYFDTNSLSEQQKIEQIRRLIRDNLKSEECDYWLFGHNVNFKLFFSETFNIASEFEFGETRSVYNVQQEPGSTSLFNPPYAFIIDQNTGRIRGKYAERTLALEQDPWTLTLVVGSTHTMHEKGLEPSSPQHTLYNQQRLNSPTIEVTQADSPLSRKQPNKTKEPPDTPTPTI